MACGVSDEFYELKQGATFTADSYYRDGAGNLIDITATGTQIKSQVRTPAGDLIADLLLNVYDQTTDKGHFVLYGDTSTWPPGKYNWDIRITEGTTTIYTQTKKVQIVTAETQA